MKPNRKNIITIILLSVFIQSCQDDWLEIRPLSFYAPENVYIDKAGLDAVLLTSRKNLRQDFYGFGNTNFHENLSSDLGVDCADVASLQNFNTGLTPNGSGRFNLSNLAWNRAFNTIRNTSVAISRIDKPEWTSENEKNEILGEAFFHRAYWYYRLIHQYGDVPFISKEHTEPKLDFYTHSRKTILHKIRDDLEFAAAWVPESVEPGKINSAAVKHLLTKVYLANSQFDKAIETATSIINDGKYSMMTERFGNVANDDRFNVIWDLHQKENKSIPANTEGILVCQDKFGYPDASTDGTASMRNFSPFWCRTGFFNDPDGRPATTDAHYNPQILAIGRGVGQFRPSNYFNYELWAGSEADLRHDSDTNWMPKNKVLVNNPNSAYYGQPLDINHLNSLRDTFKAIYPWPHYKIYVSDEIRPHQPIGGNSDWYIFRLAETYLLRAEAYFWKGELANGAADINKVRARSKAPLISAADVSIDYILDERARELYLEEPRKTELTRIALIMAENNIDGYSLANFSEKNYWFDRVEEKNFYNKGVTWLTNSYQISPYHVFWPIPQDAIDSNTKGRINQNIGYNGAGGNISPKTEITDEQ